MQDWVLVIYTRSIGTGVTMKIYYMYAAVLILVILMGYGLYYAGGMGCRAASANAARESLERQDKLAAKLADERAKQKVIYRDKVRIVQMSTEECANTRYPDDILRMLPGGDKAVSSPH
jgi:hypothetical protein